ncbi:hypothetical protein yc1106_08277 [Curvularia clavata]|uniref:Uncharacterized protein n=1 Tax=Curvularia clavata TaxID=95742 RepID=A0A9Q8ZJ06_CURCL|nr:hypothetical protein yc1106_08277 [Curvularia clavata]
MDNGSMNSMDIDDIPPSEDEIPDTQPAYDLRKRTEQGDPRTYDRMYDEDKSGNFDPEEEGNLDPEEEEKVEKSNQSKSRRRKYNRNKLKPQTKQQSFIPSSQKKPGRKAPIVKSHEANKSWARTRRPINPLRPEEYLTKEDFEYLEDLEDLRVQMQLSRSPSPEVLEDSAGHKGVVTKIKTSFTHPIEFGVEGTTTDCHFCELPTYGLVGSFEKEIHCIRWDNGLGFTPLNGVGAETTTIMCQGCTMGRAQIACCENHDIRPVNPSTLDFAEALEDLLTQETPHMIKEQLQRWETFGGDVDAMAAAIDQENKAGEKDEDIHGKVRADVGFLCRDGILMANVENAAGEPEDEEASV